MKYLFILFCFYFSGFVGLFQEAAVTQLRSVVGMVWGALNRHDKSRPAKELQIILAVGSGCMYGKA